MKTETRHDWTREEIRSIYEQPILELIYQAASILRKNFNGRHMQLCHLISIKTGGCPEDCKYCSQSSYYQTETKAEPLLSVDEVIERAKKAKNEGATRICLAAAWRGVRHSQQFNTVLEMIKKVSKLGVEVCCTLGLLDELAALKLRDAGLYAYNHNLDTSPEYYPKIITTRTYQDRINTLEIAEQAGLSICCGGILGLGESEDDRIGLLHALATRKHHPESVPINLLTAVKGTPLENNERVKVWDVVRMAATARILMPNAMVRLSCARYQLTQSEQALCFLAGVNSFFIGEKKLLTTPNPTVSEDQSMLQLLGLISKPLNEHKRCCSTTDPKNC